MIYIDIQSIPHNEQRYSTCGDFYDTIQATENGRRRLNIRVSDVGNADYEFLVALHELVECYLCKKRGITEKQVDDFDLNFKGEGEPGDDPKSPYFKEHGFASIIERIVASELGIDWKAYNATLEELDHGK